MIDTIAFITAAVVATIFCLVLVCVALGGDDK